MLPLLQGKDGVACLNAISKAYYVNALPMIYEGVQTDTARLFALAAYDSAVKIQDSLGMADALQNLGEIARDRGDFGLAEKFFRQSIPLFKTLQAFEKASWANLTFGWCVFLQNHSIEARQAYEKALPYYLKAGMKPQQAMLYRLISYTYSAQGYNEKAFANMKIAFGITRQINDFRGAVSGPENVAMLYKDAGQIQTALTYYQLAAQNAKIKKAPVRYNKLMGDIWGLRNNVDSAIYYYHQTHYLITKATSDTAIRKRDLANQSLNIGELLLKHEKYSVALNFFKTSLPCMEAGNDRRSLMHAWLGIAACYLKLNNVTASFQYAKKLLASAQAAGARPFIRDALDVYWQVYDKQGKTDLANARHLQYIAIRDSILQDEYLRNIALAEMKDNEEEQQSKIDLLQKNKLITQQRLTLQQQQLNKESLVRNILVSSIALVVLLGVIIFRNILLKRRNEKLESEKTKTGLRQQAAELEMQALRAQMNPHFIFNSLNSVNRFILQNNKVQASAYLTKFSRLVRLILQHSQASLITLDSELQALELYLELEALRFDYHFDYKISIPHDLDSAILKLPPLSLQPYVENAIWHGLMHKEERGQLDIDISEEGAMLYIKITDNGVGRKRAAIASKRATTHTSMGLQLTARRIAMMEGAGNQSASVEINDLVDPDGTAAGTEVVVKIPVLYD